MLDHWRVYCRKNKAKTIPKVEAKLSVGGFMIKGRHGEN
jgi:hypothetical protein